MAKYPPVSAPSFPNPVYPGTDSTPGLLLAYPAEGNLGGKTGSRPRRSKENYHN